MNPQIQKSIEQLSALASSEMKSLILNAQAIGASNARIILLCGETGTEKTDLAALIHEFSSRRNAPFVRVDAANGGAWATVTQLFGEERRIWPSQESVEHQGAADWACEGTLLIEHVEHLPLEVQDTLFDVLTQGTFRRVGGGMNRPFTARLIATSGIDPTRPERRGDFSPAFANLLAPVILTVPPLRSRRVDIRALTLHFSRLWLDIPPEVALLSDEASEFLFHYEWPWNTAELHDMIQRIALLRPKLPLSTAAVEEMLDLTSGEASEKSMVFRLNELENLASRDPFVQQCRTKGLTLQQAEALLIAKTLGDNDGNRTQTARQLGIARSTLLRRLDLYGINVPLRSVDKRQRS